MSATSNASFPSASPPTDGIPTDQWLTYGPLKSMGNIRQGVISLLSDPIAGVTPYLREIERQNGMQPNILWNPQGIGSYRNGIDFERWESDVFPLLIVVVNPAGQTGEPERFGGGEYGIMFELQVAALVEVVGGTEEDAIAVADAYGPAVAASILQHGSLGGIATKTVLMSFPRTEFPSPTGPRNIVRSIGSYQVYVQPVLAERYGPPLEQTPLAPGVSKYPSVVSTNVEFEAVDLPD